VIRLLPLEGVSGSLAYMCIADACPRDVLEAPSTARDHHQQQAASMELVSRS